MSNLIYGEFYNYLCKIGKIDKSVMYSSERQDSYDGRYCIFLLKTVDFARKCNQEWTYAFYILQEHLHLLTKKTRLNCWHIKEVSRGYHQTNFLVEIKPLGEQILEEI